MESRDSRVGNFHVSQVTVANLKGGTKSLSSGFGVSLNSITLGDKASDVNKRCDLAIN